MNYIEACLRARSQSLQDEGYTKYVQAHITPGTDPLTQEPFTPAVLTHSFSTTDWYTGTCVACYSNGKWRSLN